MQSEYHAWQSPRLGQRFELNVYGWQGRPLLVFPTSNGRFFQYEDFGMVEVCAPFLDSGKLKIFAVDGIDGQAWWNQGAHPADKARRAMDYDTCIVHEVVPFIHDHCRVGPLPIMTTGCSFGAYHAVNFLLRHPRIFDTCIGLSGVYSLREFVGDYQDDNVYFNDPLRYIPNLYDPAILEACRLARIILCVGQGAWEDRFLGETRALSDALRARGIDHWLDVWGTDVNHDWPWWRKQIVYFLERLGI